jgi:surface antigen
MFCISRFAGIGGICLILGGCGSIVNIPLGSLWDSSKSDQVATDSTPPNPTPGATTSTAEVKGKSGFFSNLLPSFGEKKMAAAEPQPPSGQPFTLDAPPATTSAIPQADITGSIAPANPEEPRIFGKEDHDAVAETLAQALPSNGGATSQSWINPLTGYGGMVVPMATLKKSANASCRELLISFGKGNKKDWYKSQGCNKDGKWQLGDVTAWRTSK